jgi:hypothetical protein
LVNEESQFKTSNCVFVTTGQYGFRNRRGLCDELVVARSINDLLLGGMPSPELRNMSEIVQ